MCVHDSLQISLSLMKVAVEIWMYGINCPAIPLAVLLQSLSYRIELWQGNLGGTGLLQKPLIVCHPELIGSRALMVRADHWEGTQLNSARRSPSKCLNSVKVRVVLHRVFFYVSLYVQQAVGCGERSQIFYLVRVPTPSWIIYPRTFQGLSRWHFLKFKDLRKGIVSAHYTENEPCVISWYMKSEC